MRADAGPVPAAVKPLREHPRTDGRGSHGRHPATGSSPGRSGRSGPTASPVPSARTIAATAGVNQAWSSTTSAASTRCSPRPAAARPLRPWSPPTATGSPPSVAPRAARPGAGAARGGARRAGNVARAGPAAGRRADRPEARRAHGRRRSLLDRRDRAGAGRRLLPDSPARPGHRPAGLARAISSAFIGLELYQGVDPAGAHDAFDALERLAVLIEVVEDLGPLARRTLRARLRPHT